MNYWNGEKKRNNVFLNHLHKNKNIVRNAIFYSQKILFIFMAIINSEFLIVIKEGMIRKDDDIYNFFNFIQL